MALLNNCRNDLIVDVLNFNNVVHVTTNAISSYGNISGATQTVTLALYPTFTQCKVTVSAGIIATGSITIYFRVVDQAGTEITGSRFQFSVSLGNSVPAGTWGAGWGIGSSAFFVIPAGTTSLQLQGYCTGSYNQFILSTVKGILKEV